AEGRSRKPNLRATYVSSPPAELRPGDRLRLRDKVRNVARVRAGRSRTRFFLSLDARIGPDDLRLPGQRRVPRLRGRRASRGVTETRVPRSTPYATYRVLAWADATHTVRESRERDNCAVARRMLAVVAPD